MGTSPYRATGTRIIGIGREECARKNGTVFPVDLAVSQTVEHQRLFTGVLRDLTGRKRTETELERATGRNALVADIGAVTRRSCTTSATRSPDSACRCNG